MDGDEPGVRAGNHPQGVRSVDTQEAVYPESGFIESTFGPFFGDSEAQRERKRDTSAPRYVKGLR